jgi:hypothetical protein
MLRRRRRLTWAVPFQMRPESLSGLCAVPLREHGLVSPGKQQVCHQPFPIAPGLKMQPAGVAQRDCDREFQDIVTA